MRDNDWPEHLEEVLCPINLSSEIHALEVVWDNLKIPSDIQICESLMHSQFNWEDN